MNIKSLLVVAVLASAILCSAGFVKAQATDNSALIAQIQAEIQSLMQQITALQTRQGTTQTWCHNFNTYFVASSTDATTNGDVSQLQTALTKQGFDVSGDTQGNFGDSTAAAVVQFQGKNGITQTGTVGPKTRAALNALYGCTPGQAQSQPATATQQSTVTPQVQTPITITTPSTSGLISNSVQSPNSTQSLTPPSVTSTCTSWTYSSWGTSECINGIQTRTILSALPIGCTGGTPDLTQSCSLITITSPNNGATVSAGSNFSITFTAPNLPQKIMQATLNNTDTGASYGLAQINNGATGLQTTVSESIPARAPAGNHYTLTLSATNPNCSTGGVEGAGCVIIATSSGYFSVGPSVIPVPAINITSPSSGQTITGTSIPVTFTASNLTGNTILPILMFGGNACNFPALTNISNGTQTINLTINPASCSGTPTGNNFMLELNSPTDGMFISGTFSITSSASGSTSNNGGSQSSGSSTSGTSGLNSNSGSSSSTSGLTSNSGGNSSTSGSTSNNGGSQSSGSSTSGTSGLNSNGGSGQSSTSLTQPPTIAITVPSSGQYSFAVGSSIPMTITGSNLIGAEIWPMLTFTAGSGVACNFPPTNISNGTQTINLTISASCSNNPTGNYEIGIQGLNQPNAANLYCNATGPGCTFNATSNPISITAQTTSYIDIQNQLAYISAAVANLIKQIK